MEKKKPTRLWKPRAQSGAPCWVPLRQQFSFSGGEFSQDGAAQGSVPSQEGSVSLQVRMRGPAFHISSNTGTPGAFPSPCLVAHRPSAPQSLSLRASLWLHFWAPGELLLLYCLSTLGISESLLSLGEVLGRGTWGDTALLRRMLLRRSAVPRPSPTHRKWGVPQPLPDTHIKHTPYPLCHPGSFTCCPKSL